MTSLVEIYRRFPTTDSCHEHLARVRWPAGPTCPKCGQPTPRQGDEGRSMPRWRCWRCKLSFSATAGTIFHNSHVDLQRWFLLIGLMLNAKKGLSAMQAARDLDMRRPTVWSMMHRIRNAMADGGTMLAGIIEMDETYIGGRPRKRNRRSDDPPGGQGVTSKRPVLGAVERGGRAKMKAVERSELTAADLRRFVVQHIQPRGSLLTTDEYSGYNGLNGYIAHRRINHSVSYVERDLFAAQFGLTHTNTIESLWAILKRAIVGQFHHVSAKHLPLYLNEVAFRYNLRRRDDGFAVLLHASVSP